MKKIICLLTVLVLCMSLVVPAMAAEDSFVPSITYKPNPEIVPVAGEDGQEYIGVIRDKEGKIHADYNAFWESVGGVCDAERHYRLPAQIARKEIAEIASKKRAEYRRRYEMLDAIQPQMATMFRG